MSIWPKPHYHEPSWEVPLSPDILKVSETILDKADLDIGDAWVVADKTIDFRAIRYPFYPAVLSIEARIALPFDEGFYIGAWLVDEQSHDDVEDRTQADDGEREKTQPKIYFLNGTSPPIHELNAQHPIKLTDDAMARAYLKFFCAHVWGDEGGFWVCTEADQGPLKDTTSVNDSEGKPVSFKDPEFLRQEDGNWVFSAMILYSGVLFEALMSVQPKGIIEMIDDDPIAADLSVFTDERADGFRIISAERVAIA